MRTKTSLLAIVGVMSVVGATSVFGAATVRTLGGAGTYTGVSSAAAAKSSGTTASGTTTTRSRAGTIRVNPSVSMSGSGAKTTQTVATANSGATVSSGNDGADSRMSIGKYLNGSALTSFGKSSSGTGTPSDGTMQQIQRDISDLQNQVAGHDTDISNLESVIGGYDSDISALKSTVGDEVSGLVADVADLSDIIGDDTSGLIADVADLQDTIGDGVTDGLLKRVADLESAGSPDMSAYATQAWVNEQGFLTEHQDLSDYATKDMLTDLPAAPSGTGSGGAIYVLNKETDAGAPTWEKVVVQQNWDE